MEVVVESVATNSFRVYWREWGLQLLLIISLGFQFLLMIMGHVRKVTNGGFFPLVSGVAYLTYLLADLAATVSLSTLLRAKVTLDNSLVLLWTPFLLWHLGGPSNVTAYSLEDNQIWIRHFVGLLIHVSEAFYICINFGIHADRALRFVAASILIAGVIKYGERAWALQSASETKLVERHFFGGREVIDEIIERNNIEEMDKYLGQPEIRFFRQAYLTLKIFTPLFFGLSTKFCRQGSIEILDAIRDKSPEEAFRLAEIELAFLYDTLYTKIPTQITKWGLFRRILCLLLVIYSLLTFSLVSASRHYYRTTDIFLTYLLFLGAMLLECFSIAMCLLSTWALVKFNGKMITSRQRLLARLRSTVVGRKTISMGQHDLIDQYCFKHSVAHPMRSLTRALFGVNNTQRILWNSTWIVIDADLKEYIHRYVTDPRNSQHLLDDSQTKLMVRKILQRLCKGSQLEQWIEDGFTGFISFIFVFHIATNLSYHNDIKKYPTGSLGEGFRISKCLSDYMMYLTLVRPLMLPKGMADVINKDTEKQSMAMRIRSRTLEEAKTEFTKELHTMLLYRNHPAAAGFPFQQKQFNTTMLGAGTYLSQLLHHLSVISHQFDNQNKWDMICRAWADILAYAAFCCPWKEHAQQLRDGGELLTYVALLSPYYNYAK